MPVDLVPRAFLFEPDMHDKDPSTYGWLIYLGFAGLSGWGAIGNCVFEINENYLGSRQDSFH